MRYLDSEDARVVSNTIDALVKVTNTPDRATITKLETLLNHEDNRVKSTAIRTLWLWGQYDVLDSLLKLFNSDDKKHVLSAIFVFGEIGRAISDDESLSSDVNSILTSLLEGKEEPQETTEAATESAPETEKETETANQETASKTTEQPPN